MTNTAIHEHRLAKLRTVYATDQLTLDEFEAKTHRTRRTMSDLTFHTHEMLDTGLGKQHGYPNDKAYMQAITRQRAQLPEPEQRIANDMLTQLNAHLSGETTPNTQTQPPTNQHND